MSTTPLLVLGMHRSGTSALAGTLVRLGGAAPRTLLAAQFDNERGFFESKVIMRVNDDILASGGSAWHDWRAFDRRWYGRAAAARFRARAAAALVDEFADATLPVVKDPRICRLMPFWSSVFRGLGWSPRVLLPVRPPLEVAASLHRRDGMPANHGCLLWLRHVLEAEAESRDIPRAVIDWNGLLSDWRLALARADEQMGLALPKWRDADFSQVEEFLSADLRHHIAAEENVRLYPAVDEWVRTTYAAMLELVADQQSAGARRDLDEVRARFNEAEPALGRALRHYEPRWSPKQARKIARGAAGRKPSGVGALLAKWSNFARRVSRSA